MLKQALTMIVPLAMFAMLGSDVTSADAAHDRVAQAKKSEDPLGELSDLLDKGYGKRKPPSQQDIAPSTRDNVRIKERAIRQFDDQQRLEAERRLLDRLDK